MKSATHSPEGLKISIKEALPLIISGWNELFREILHDLQYVMGGDLRKFDKNRWKGTNNVFVA